VLAYLALQTIFWNWTVDDAAITYAYSENLVRGHGLVLHPNQPPQEGYSTTLWMLILAAARLIGLPIDIAGKVLGIVAGAAAIVISVRACEDLYGKRRKLPIVICAIVAVGAPFVVWTGSGLEHALQSLLFVSVAAMPLLSTHPIWPMALCLGALILLRPEAPLIAAAVIFVLACQRRTWPRTMVELWPLVAVPGLIALALFGFRLWYFGDLLPNPYYAKASEATFLRVFNLVGGAWDYVRQWMAASGAYMLVPLLLLGLSVRVRIIVQLAAAITAAQLVFVLYAGGDWMGCFRFIAPVLPLLAILLAEALRNLESSFSRTQLDAAVVVIAVFLGIAAILQLHQFRAGPTTPASVVADIGREFVKLAALLGIEHPTLAHHDAGGTSWAAGIDVIDLGGLGNRAIAKHMRDNKFMRQYLFVERRPTFIFGSASTFAAGLSGFASAPEFSEQYVPVSFPNRSFMKADLSHIRRDVVRGIKGISLVEEQGRLVRVVVNDEATIDR
jgi:hypothetical protein